MLITVAVSGYRSIRDLVLPLGRLNVVSGANGSGKSSVYKAIRLLAETGQGRVVAALAREGGLGSTLWAGPEKFSAAMKAGRQPVQGTVRNNPVSLRLGFADEDYGYAIDLGLPLPSASMFVEDPEIKAEAVWVGEALSQRNVFAERHGPHVSILDEAGRRASVLTGLPPYDSMMTHAADPKNASELLLLRERMRGWRFYDHFRTDPEAAARWPHVGTRTQVLASDGSDLAAAIQTILEIGDGEGFAQAVEDAFPGSSVEIEANEAGFRVLMRQPGLLRPLRAAEFSDGTLRYLCLAAALLSPRPPSLLVLNEPETSLHPELIDPLARLLARTSHIAQMIVVTHSLPLATALRTIDGTMSFTLAKELGETVVIEQHPRPAWNWPSRRA
ncbi:AAA family ATPase [Nitratireductor pacificus]|uniref:Putative ATPase n=1 Tax=Nitratireductor pacificus pht-3B TaxID=391937 RepID=K2M5L6_9HYPH|nr:AAA family ATPase [Nitratireductor pacificus]EKF17436.1 putative ATPase [Nitratireductor pacificus pht-3B]